MSGPTCVEVPSKYYRDPGGLNLNSIKIAEDLKTYQLYQPEHGDDIPVTADPLDPRPLHVGYVNNIATPLSTEYLTSNDVLFRHVRTTNWEEFSHILGQQQPDSISLHVSVFEQAGITAAEFVNMVESMARLATPGHRPRIAVAIENNTRLGTVKDLKAAGVFGIIPCSNTFSGEETQAGMIAVATGVPYWPLHILDHLPGNRTTVTQPIDHNIRLTDRQQQVCDLICNRGLSNKQIARALSLSESTVKIHVSAIMRAHGVRNRTQLALLGGSGLRA